MATKIIQKMGAGEPAPESLDIAELAVDVVNGNLYTKLNTGDVVLAGGSSGSGSSVHIGETPPDDPEEGQQWMEVPADGDAVMWIYDDGNGGQWLQHPSGSSGVFGNIEGGNASTVYLAEQNINGGYA